MRPLSYDGDDFLERIELARRARYARDFYLEPKPPVALGIPADLEKNLELSKMRGLECVDAQTYDVWLHSLFHVARIANPVLEPADADAIWSRFERAPCYKRLAAEDRQWLQLFRAAGAREAPAMARHADEILAGGKQLSASHKQYLLAASLTGNILTGQFDRAQSAWDKYSADASRSGLSLDLRLLYAYLAVAKAAPPAQAQAPAR